LVVTFCTSTSMASVCVGGMAVMTWLKNVLVFLLMIL
jgi:hypothetical protein